MSEMIKTLIEKRANTWEALKATLDKAEAEKRELTVDEQKAFDDETRDLDSLDSRIKTLIETEQRDADIQASFRDLGEREQKRGIREDGPDVKTTADQLRAMLRGEVRQLDFKPPANSTLAEELRTLSKLSAGAGANLVGQTFYNRLIEHLIETATLVNLASTMTTATGEQIALPKTSSYGTAALVAEAGTIPASDPAFGQAVLDAYKYGKLLQISHELVNDTGFDIEGFIAKEAGRAVGIAFGAHLMSGTGTNQPNGLLTAVTTGVTGGAGVGGAFTTDNLIDLKYSVTAPYRARGASWLLRDASVGALRKIKDGQGRYLWEPGLQVGAPNRFDGDVVNTEINTPAIALGAKSVLYGDFSAYMVRLVETVRFESSVDFAFNTDLVTYRCLLRGDGDLLDTTGAIKAFVGNAA